jgi:hypothetical protein
MTPANDPHLSCAGLTRASISFAKAMDCRLKAGNDDHDN